MQTEERRGEPRHRVNEGGLVVVDEHTLVPCLLHDRSASGVRLTMPDTKAVPTTFVLIAQCLGVAHVCTVVWRDDEVIGARLDRATAW